MSRPHDAKFDDEPSEARFELVSVEDRARFPVRHVKLATAAAAIIVLALVGIDLLPAGEATGEDGAAGSLASSSAPTFARAPSPVAATSPHPFPHRGEIVPGRYLIGWPEQGLEISVTMPGGWWAEHWGGGTVISRGDRASGRYDTTLSIHDVARVMTDACATVGRFVEVGPTVEDLTGALASMVGVLRTGPADTMVGSHPATRFTIALQGSCPGPESRPLLESASGPGSPGLAKDGTATIDIVDVDGDRVVITTQSRATAATGDVAQLAAIVASIDIERDRSVPVAPASLPAGELAIGDHELTVDGMTLAFTVATAGWISGDPARGGGRIHKGEPGAPDGAEIAFWSPDNVFADPCAGVPLSPPVGPSTDDLAAAIADLPGTLSTRPADLTVGGAPAKLVVVTIPEDTACDAGSHRLWYQKLGAIRSAGGDGSTIRVWIVDGGRDASAIAGSRGARRIVIEGVTGGGATPELEAEIERIVGSISFCCG